ncbi:hypothetical protein SCAR479_12650 [Seiridium cardinale]|uniref:Uncharacterized protein n=1 Tax=Seiridium cardinale TaxID=138064 RepID=A0ABR2XAD8_9PEZI
MGTKLVRQACMADELLEAEVMVASGEAVELSEVFDDWKTSAEAVLVWDEACDKAVEMLLGDEDITEYVNTLEDVANSDRVECRAHPTSTVVAAEHKERFKSQFG